MSEPIISVNGIGKRYLLGATGGQDTLRDSLANLFKGIVKRQGLKKSSEQELWALKDVTFEVQPGEVMGVIGRNGAGKSTLLKILSQITEPTVGEITIRGRIASLLEVGTGFHPELTGRENIYLNGAILGMARQEIAKKFDEIIAFAEVEKFLDTPVKRYSSGMYVRLAFAVAAHLEPEVLVVDEVLAVGDASFQAKCLAKMGDVAQRGGRTVLFVSHNLQAVQTLCDSAILFEGGRLKYQGATGDVVNAYLSSGVDKGNSSERVWSEDDSPGNHEIKLRRVSIIDEQGLRSGVFFTSKKLFIEMEFHCYSLCSSLCVGFDLATPEGETVLRTYHNDQELSKAPELKLGVNIWRCEIPAGLLNSGAYLVYPKITRHTLYWILNHGSALKFDMTLDHGVSPYWSGLRSRTNRPGVISPILNWEKVN